VGAALAGTVYISNGRIKLGVDAAYGGAMTYLSAASNNHNVINIYDKGREIQQSYYSGPTPFKGGRWSGKDWGWNPVMAGDWKNNTGPATVKRTSSTSLYVRAVPMQWALDNVRADCIMESWIQLDGTGVIVRNKLTNRRSDRGQYRAYHQELPAVYVNGPYYRLFTYNGPRPWTSSAPTEVSYPVPGPPWQYYDSTEKWSAFLNADLSFGLGVYNPIATKWVGGFAGNRGSGGPKDFNTGYVSPLIEKSLGYNEQFTWSYRLALGNLNTIRNYFAGKRAAMEMELDW